MKCAGHFHAFPAHHKPLQPLKRLRTMRRRSCCNLALLSEVVIGSVEPIMSCVSCETRCKYMKILPIIQRKRTKTYAFMASWAAAIRFWRLLYLGTGEKVRANRERDGM